MICICIFSSRNSNQKSAFLREQNFREKKKERYTAVQEMHFANDLMIMTFSWYNI